MTRGWLLVLGALLLSIAAASSLPSQAQRAGPAAEPDALHNESFAPPDWVVRRMRAIPGFRPVAAGPHQQDYEHLIDDFEMPVLNPFMWSVYDADRPPEEFGEYYWGLSTCKASSSRQSLWAIGAGADGRLLACGSDYPNGVRSVATLRIDLSGWSEAPDKLQLHFDTWLYMRIEPSGGVVPDGLFVHYIHYTSEGEPIPILVFRATSQFPDDWWKTIELDLRNLCDLDKPELCYDVWGQKDVQVQWTFKTKDEIGGELREGAFIDNVKLVAYPGPDEVPTTPPPTITPTEPITPTPTITTTVTVTATTSTPTATVTPTVTITPSPTKKTGFLVYLPSALNGEPGPEPTDVPPSPPPMQEVVLSAIAGSGISGTALLTEYEQGLTVDVAIQGGPPDGVHPANILVGTCGDGGEVEYALTDVEQGSATTMLGGVMLAEIADGRHSIAVLRSSEEPTDTVACGNVEALPPP